MKNVKTLAKNFLSLTIAEMGGKGLAFITSLLFLANRLGADGNGVYTWATSFVMLFTAITVFGLDYVAVRESARDKSKIPTVASSIISMRLALASFSYLLIIILLFLFQVDSEKFIATLIYALTLFTYAFAFDWVFRAEERMEILAIRQLLTGVLNLIGVWLLVQNRGDLILAVSIFTATNIINAIWMYILYYKRYGSVNLVFKINNLIGVAKETYQTALLHFISIFYNFSGAFFITLLYKSDFETGIYGAATKIYAFSLLFSQIIPNVFFPQISAAKEGDERIDIVKKFATMMFLCACIICFGVYLFSGELIERFMIHSYLNSIQVIQALMLVGLISFYNMFLSQPLIAWKQEKYSLKGIFVGGAVNVIASFIFIPFYGAIGAVIAIFLSEIAVFCILSYYFKKVFGRIFMPLFLKTIGIGIVIAIGIIALQNLHVNFVALLALYLIVFLFLGLLINGIKPNEIKNLLIKR